MPACAGRVEASVEDAQTGVRSGFVSRATTDGAPAGSQTEHVVMVGRRAGRSASVALGIAMSLLPIRRLLSPNLLDVWGRQGARRSARTRTPGDRRAPLAGGRPPPPRADRTAVRETLGSLQDGAWPDAGSGSSGRSSGDDAPARRAGSRAAGCSSRLCEGLRGPEANPSASDRRAAQGASPQGTRSRLVFVIAGNAAALRAGPRPARPSRSLSRATRSGSPSRLSAPPWPGPCRAPASGRAVATEGAIEGVEESGFLERVDDQIATQSG